MPSIGWRRRTLLAAGAAGALAPPRAARAVTAVNVVLESEVVILDPHETTAAITRSFATHVFDTLFAMDDAGAIHPQMAEGHTVSPDGLEWRIRLRDGLRFHDGNPVLSTDVVASLDRWMPRDALGRMLLAATRSLDVADARTIVFQLREPFPLVLEVLGKPNAPVPAIMPERIARAAARGRITEIIGSGPFTFRRDLWWPGNSMQLDRNADYIPRPGPADFLAGGKRVAIDQLNLKVMPDQATASSALIAGEIDYQQYVPFDYIARLERTRGVQLLGLGGLHMFQGNFRLNHATPPFDDPAIRQVLWQLVDQQAVLTAIGVPARFGVSGCTSFWMCGAPLDTAAGGEVFRPDIPAARAALARTAYAGQKLVMLEVSGSISQTASMLLAENLRAAGFAVEQQVMDWGTVLARRARREGWSIFSVYSNGIDMISPLTHFYVANTCADYPGWSCDPAIPPLLGEFARTADPAARQALAARIQRQAYALTPAVSWGQFTIPAAHRDHLRGLVRSSFPIFWQVARG